MLIPTTLLHLTALSFPVSLPYSSMIVLSTTLSVLWHAAGEPDGLLLWADYGVAGLWYLLDLWYAVPLDAGAPVLLLSPLIAILNSFLDHSLWHVLSASKAVYVAYLIHRGMRSSSERGTLIERGFASNDEYKNTIVSPSIDEERQYSMPWV